MTAICKAKLLAVTAIVDRLLPLVGSLALLASISPFSKPSTMEEEAWRPSVFSPLSLTRLYWVQSVPRKEGALGFRLILLPLPVGRHDTLDRTRTSGTKASAARAFAQVGKGATAGALHVHVGWRLGHQGDHRL